MRRENVSGEVKGGEWESNGSSRGRYAADAASGVHDDGDEDGEDAVRGERYEEVEIGAQEQMQVQRVHLCREVRERAEHVVPVDQ